MEIVQIEKKSLEKEGVKVLDPAELDFDLIPRQFMISAKGRGHEKIAYMTDFMTFDIETTTMPGVKNPKGGYFKPPWAFMYQWQTCIAGQVVFGRYWDDLFDLWEKVRDELHLKKLKRMVCFVHNLGFEFSFLYPFLKERYGELQIFATAPHQPVKIFVEALGIEFRCSWKMSNMNLYNFTKTELGCPYVKPYDDLEYRKIRTPKTQLTAREKSYCVVDVLGLYWAVKSKMAADHDTIASLPITSTGYPRRITRRACRKYFNYREQIFNKLKLTPFIYQMLKEAGRGGSTHANRYFANLIWEDVTSYDDVSEYPAVMLLEDYPMSAWSSYGEIESLKELDELCKEKAVLFRVYIENPKVRPEVAMPYIATDKLTMRPPGSRIKADNGRVLEAEGVIGLTINEIDWEIIKKQYTWSKNGIIIKDVQIAEKGPLPEPIRETILGFFSLKCELKMKIKAKEKELEKDPDNKKLIDELNELNYRYGKVKNLLNSIFGMMYTDPCRMETTVDDQGKWSEKLPAGKSIEDLLNKFNNSRNSFLVYSWGVWVTSYGRKYLDELQSCTIDEDGKCWAIYSDTDSCKSQYWDEKKLQRLIRKQKKKCEERGAYWEAPDGHREYMGYPELDSKAKRFKTLGAKKYAYEDEKGLLHVTISGVGNTHRPGDKLGVGARELLEHGGLDALEVGFVFQDAGGPCVWYGHEDPHEVTVNGCTFRTASYAAITDGSYKVGMTEEYKKLLGCL